MDKQTWSDALMKVGRTLWKWVYLLPLPLSFWFARLANPLGAVLECLNIGFCLFMMGFYSVKIVKGYWHHRMRMRLLELRRIEMDAAMEEVKRCQAEFIRLLRAQGDLVIDGKTEEAKAMSPQMAALIEEQTHWMLKSIGIEEPNTK